MDAARTKVVESILENKEEHDLGDDGCPAREGHLPGCHAKELCHGVEKPDLHRATYENLWDDTNGKNAEYVRRGVRL